MFYKVFICASFLVACLAVPTPDGPQRQYQPPSNQYSQPEPNYFQPQPQPQPQYSQPKPQYRPEPRYEEPQQSLEPPKYNFEWAVKDDYSGNDFGHQETRDGYDTKGSYFVLLPDGRRQTVTYYVNGDSGYVAQVEYEGEARYPESQESYRPQPQPSYQQPRPQPSYQQPQPQPQPQPSYQQPQPQPQPQPSYQQPQQSYQQPQSQYGF